MWSILIYMIKRNLNTPQDNINAEQVKLYYFSDELREYVENLPDNRIHKQISSKIVVKHPSNGIIILRQQVPVCPECKSRKINKTGYGKRKLKFIRDGTCLVMVQRYKCKECGKSFQTDLSSIVKPNANFTHEFKEKIKNILAKCKLSLNEAVYVAEKCFNVIVSHQTIENLIFDLEDKIKPGFYKNSGYYLVDAEWIRIEGVWWYRLTLFDSKQNTVVADELFPDQKSKTVKKFLTEATRNQPKHAITTDLDTVFKSVIEKIGCKHQYCIFHKKQSINKKVHDYTRQNKLNKKEKKKIKKDKSKLYEIFEAKDYNEAITKLNKLNADKNLLNPKIREILIKDILPHYNRLLLYLKDKNVERTTSKLENLYQKSFPKHIKRIMKTPTGIMKIIQLFMEIWDENNKIPIHTRSF